MCVEVTVEVCCYKKGNVNIEENAGIACNVLTNALWSKTHFLRMNNKYLFYSIYKAMTRENNAILSQSCSYKSIRHFSYCYHLIYDYSYRN